MKIGNIHAGIRIIFCLIGFFCLPIYNLRELPFIGDASYPKGGGWVRLAAAGLSAKPGIILLIAGRIILLISKVLPEKYWETSEGF
jgi:hypothetical protein